jgi:hypothetical protein
VPPLRTLTPNRASGGGGGGGVGGNSQAAARRATPVGASQKNVQQKRQPFSAVEEGFIREVCPSVRPPRHRPSPVPRLASASSAPIQRLLTPPRPTRAQGERKYRHDKLIWSKILAEYPFPPGRTSVNIKDKWRNMCKNK